VLVSVISSDFVLAGFPFEEFKEIMNMEELRSSLGIHLAYERDGKHYVRIKRSDEVLLNPGMGFETYQRFNGDETVRQSYWDDDGPTHFKKPAEITTLKNKDYPDTKIAYFRRYWERIEPEQGQYRWDMIDYVLEESKKRGQQAHIRLMPHDSAGLLPKWYKEKGKLIKFKTESGREAYIPDYTDPLFIESTEKIIGLLGERYNGHPNLFAVDIGTLGFWGEWHNYLVAGEYMATAKVRRWAVDLYLKAFTKTPLVMLIGCVDALSYAVSKGAGWRADCWGDMRDNWNHMQNVYPNNLSLANANEAWKKGPVCLETCWTVLHWHKMGWDVDYILSEALRWHASLIMAKSSIIPEELQDKFAEFQKKIGYRFAAGEISFPPEIKRDESFILEQKWMNLGVAPCYNDYKLLIRFKSKDSFFNMELPHNLRHWMPGEDQLISDNLKIPTSMKNEIYELQIGIVRPIQTTPAVIMANVGRDEDGFLRVGEVKITE
jgi:hypothetical protein